MPRLRATNAGLAGADAEHGVERAPAEQSGAERDHAGHAERERNDAFDQGEGPGEGNDGKGQP